MLKFRSINTQTLTGVTSLALLLVCSTVALGQTLKARISAEIDSSQRVTLQGSRPATARTSAAAGSVQSSMKLDGMSLAFARTDAQETELQQLLAAQQNPTSSLYHKWLTPAQFAARFGVADEDIAKTTQWLEQQGFAVERVSQSRNRIFFSGTAAQVQSAFGTTLNYYQSGSTKHFAPSTDLTLPAALSGVVQSVSNLSSFRPRSHMRPHTEEQVKANFTSSQSTNTHYMTPGDVATVYDVKAAYNAGYTGVGQSIAVVGQSSVELSDIESFQSAAGLETKDPTVVLVPNSGTSTESSSDEAESDLDLEYTGGIAKGADIYFVYTGSNQNYSVWDSIDYAVETRIAPIISVSYGTCETELSTSDYATLNGVLEQAATQGQSIIAASGDSGSTDCYEDTSLTTTQRMALAVDFPSSSQYVTGLGGTEFTSAAVASTNTTYWESASGSDVISSALSYMPEQVWNDDSTSNGLSSGGGGISTLTARPSWQTGVTGIPSGNYRLVPDISLDSSPNNAGYLYCSSDSTSTGITGSCSNGFRDSSSTYLTVAGGTSFAAPIFSGMLAIINQKLNSTGQGVINSTLYTLAADSTTYASAFHDTTSGGNQCTAGSSYCSTAGKSEYAAGTGYDEASGLGSVDLYNLMTAWPTSSTGSSTLAATTVTLTAATSTPASGASDLITITVAPKSSTLSTTATGTVTLTVDGTALSSSLTLSSGVASYTFSSTTTGSHVIQAVYSGDTTYAGSSGSIALTVGSSSSTGNTSFTLAATNITVKAGSSGTSTITITPLNGYTGTVGWEVDSSSSLSNACYDLSNATVSGTSSVSAVMTIYTSSSACSSASSVNGAPGARKRFVQHAAVAHAGKAPLGPHSTGSGFAVAGVLLAGFAGWRRRRLAACAALAAMVLIGLVVSGCGGSSGSSSSSSSAGNETKGSYTLSIVGTDTSSSSITASTTMTLTIN